MEEPTENAEPRASAPRLPDLPPPGPVLVCRVVQNGVETERLARVVRVYRNDVLALEACDHPALSPRLFFAKEAADWAKLTDWVLAAWSGARLKLPPGFRLRRRLPDEILERMRALPVPERRILLASLRENGFLPPALPLADGFLPEGVRRSDLPSLCLTAPGETPQNAPAESH